MARLIQLGTTALDWDRVVAVHFLRDGSSRIDLDLIVGGECYCIELPFADTLALNRFLDSEASAGRFEEFRATEEPAPPPNPVTLPETCLPPPTGGGSTADDIWDRWNLTAADGQGS